MYLRNAIRYMRIVQFIMTRHSGFKVKDSLCIIPLILVPQYLLYHNFLISMEQLMNVEIFFEPRNDSDFETNFYSMYD